MSVPAQTAAASLEELVSQSLEEYYGLRAEALTTLAGGYIHAVWRVETSAGPVCAKWYAPDWSARRIRAALAVQVHAALGGLPVPAVRSNRSGYGLAPAGDGHLAVCAWCEGEALPAERLGERHAQALGSLLARLHRRLEGLGLQPQAPKPDASQVHEEAERLMEAACERAEPDELDELALEAAGYRLDQLARGGLDLSVYDGEIAQIVHGDYYPGNVLWSGQGVGALIDWDFAGPKWRGGEIARAAVESALGEGNAVRPALLKAFVRGYVRITPLAEASLRAMFTLWYYDLFASFYPLSLRYRAGATLPAGWGRLARRRHELLIMLGERLRQLGEWAAEAAS